MHIDKINQRIKEVNQLVLDLSSKYNWFDFQFSLSSNIKVNSAKTTKN